MNVMKRKTLERFWREHVQSKGPLLQWFKIARKARWRHFRDVRNSFRSADTVTVKSGKTATIFDVAGNNVRVLALIDYTRQRVVITHVLTHPEYDTNRWKAQI